MRCYATSTLPTCSPLIEVFEDEAAFERHRAAPHYERWMTMSAGWRVDEARVRHVMDFLSRADAT